MTNLSELFESSQTVSGLVGFFLMTLLLLCTWFLKRVFAQYTKIVTDKISEIEDTVKTHGSSLISMDKAFAVQNEKSAGVFTRIEDTIKSIRSDSMSAVNRIEILESHVFVRTRTKKRKGETHV